MTAAQPPPLPRPDAATTNDVSTDALEQVIGRVLVLGALAGVGLLLVGVGLMVAGGIAPTSGTATDFDPARLGPDLLAGRVDAFLWAGIAVLIATPIVRVVGELAAFAWRRDPVMTAVAAAILAVIVLGVVLGSVPDA